MTDKQFKRVLIFISLIAICLQGGLFLSGFYGISADESGRTLDAYSWTTRGTPQSDAWLPFHRVLVGSALLLWNNLFIVPRIISFFLGLAALGAIVWLSSELFHDRRITVTTALLGAVFPYRVILSVVPLSEIEFIVLIIAGMATFVRWIYNREVKYILLTSIWIGISTSCRYEGWAFALMFICILFFLKSYRTKLLHEPLLALPILIVSIFPVYWILTSFIETRTFFNFANSTVTHYTRSADQSFIKLIWRNPASQFIYQNLVTLNFIGIIALVRLSYRQNKIRLFFFLFLSVLTFLTLLGFFGKALPTHNPWRIPVVLSCMLLPFTAYWLINNMAKFRFSMRWIGYGVSAIVIIAFLVQLKVMTHNPFFTHSEYEAGRFLETKLIEGRLNSPKVLIETSDWSYINIILASNLPDSFIYNTGFEPHSINPPLMDSNGFVDGKYLYDAGIRFLAFKSDIPGILLSKESVHEIKKCGSWVLYEVAKPGS